MDHEVVQRWARIAGAAYALIIVGSFAGYAVFESKLVVPGDPVTTAARIVDQTGRYRAGLMTDLVMFAGVALLAVALYHVLRGVDPRLALVGLTFRVLEAGVGLVAVVVGFLVPVLAGWADGPARTEALDTVLTWRAATMDAVIVCLCLGTLTFLALFWRSRYVPRWLTGYGVVSIGAMLVATVIAVVAGRDAELLLLSYVPGSLFELGIGLWLLVRGVQVRELQVAAPGRRETPVSSPAG